jgi:hypothetical protein
VLQIRDAQGNPVTVAGTVVSAAIASGPGGTIVGSGSATTNGTGTATFSGLGISGGAGAYTIGFSSGSLNATSSVSETFHWPIFVHPHPDRQPYRDGIQWPFYDRLS